MMISDTEIEDGTGQRSLRFLKWGPPGVSIGAVLLMWTVLGCSTTPDRQTEQAYQSALERLVQGHVYEMGCEALLPLAEQVLWEAGYREVTHHEERDEIVSEWADRDGMRQVQYAVHTHRVSASRCAAQFILRERAGQSQNQRRDATRELELLELVDEQEAQRVRMQARQEAKEARETTH